MKKKRKINIIAIILVLMMLVEAAILIAFIGKPIYDNVISGEIDVPEADLDTEEDAMEVENQDEESNPEMDSEPEDTTETGEKVVKFDLGWDESWVSPTAAPSSQKTEEEVKKEVTYPYSIPGTNLVLQKVSSYSGAYLEDGSDAEISGVAAAVVKNTGSSDIEYAQITMKKGNQQLEFEATGLEAGKTVVIQEKNKASYSNTVYDECIGNISEEEKFEMSSKVVKVVENEDGSITVTNLTDKEIPCVRVFYKFYMPDENTYIGGITYNAKLLGLEAKGSQTVSPSHYAAGYSHVVMVRTYDTDKN